MVFEILAGIGAGILTGLALAGGGYFKKVKDEGGLETFKPEKFVQTIIVGAIVGASAGAAGVDYTQTYHWFGGAGGITAIEYLSKIVWRRIKDRF